MERGFIFSLIFAAIVAVFALNNGDKVLVDFLFTKVEISQAIIIFASAILGAVTVSILSTVKNIKFRKEIKELNKKINSIEEQRKSLEILLEERENGIKTPSEKSGAEDTYMNNDNTEIE
ncbi:MAG: LapA family protein [Tissierellia bacterium]|nr:LapA family protein [Tissierellia bacterium]